MIVSQTSVETVLQMISSLGLSGSGWQGEAIEYIGEAVQGIGFHAGYEKFSDMKVEVYNHKAHIPSCIETIHGVKSNGCPLVLAYDTDNMCECNPLKSPASYNDITKYNEIIDNINCLRERILQGEEDKCDTTLLTAMKEELNRAYAMIGTFGTLGSGYSSYKGGWFSIENKIITVPFAEGEIELSGLRYKIDDRGYPLLVDSFKYKTAVYWYTLFKLLIGEYDHPKLNWKEAFQMWEEYREQAENEGFKLSPIQMDRFVHRWNSITRDARELYIR